MPSLRKRHVVQNGENDEDNSKSSDEISNERFLAIDPEHVDGNNDDNDDKKQKASDALITKTATPQQQQQQRHQQLKNNKFLTLELIDSFLNSFTKYISTASGQDACLNVLQWSLYAIPQLFLHKHNKERKEDFAKFYAQVGDARYCLRLLGLPGSIQAVRSNSWGSCGAFRDKRIDTLGTIMAWSMVCFHPAEHLAFLKWKSPSIFTPRLSRRINAETCSAYSARAWFIYVVAETLQGLLKLKELRAAQKQEQTDVTKQYDKDKHNDHAENPTDSMISTWDMSIEQEKLQILRNLCFALPCIHWGLPKWDTDPWLREGVAEGLMWVESIVRIYKNIRAMS